MTKIIHRGWFSIAIVMALINGLEVPFNTATYAYIFKLITMRDLAGVGIYLAIILGGYLFFSLLSYWQSWVVNKNVAFINLRLKTCYVEAKVERDDPSQQDFEANGLSFLMNDLKLLEDNYWRNVFRLLGYGTTILVTTGYALHNSFRLTGIFLAFMLVPMVFQRLASKGTTTKATVWSQKNAQLAIRVKELLHGAMTIRRYHAEAGYRTKLLRDVGSVEEANAALKNRIALANSLLMYLFYLFSETPIAIGIYLTISGMLTLPEFVAVQYSTNMILNSVNQMLTCINQIGSTKAVRQQLRRSIPKEGATAELPMKSTQFKKLTLTNISFKREHRDILNDINLRVQKGEKVLIQGPSGVGKSTLLSVMSKELPVTNGQLLLNGQDYDEAQVETLFSKVSQTPIIFAETIRFNLTLGMPFPESAILAAVKQAGLSDVINEPKLNQQITEGGKNLSGGQLKRIEIARALLFKRQVLLIDEGTASLDLATAKQIHDTLLSLSNLTMIEVDHHIPHELLSKYDHRYQLNNGRLEVLD
ncbi:ATP-binding cassette domain-containing protein [Furfurilactobacillus milii]|uniref:ATP-binding cassette domain-containing protein n=1 Tax=Furfurilactobacillus rossiae TaxID=231049 RepID=A0A7C9ISJ2_9LACO|nr:ABC transporter ATP-binding protein [Furfurilactobacillus milii]MYV05396.1 ATP-binding cassette domain-containing protein [Furfurilactobacillus milii]